MPRGLAPSEPIGGGTASHVAGDCRKEQVSPRLAELPPSAVGLAQPTVLMDHAEPVLIGEGRLAELVPAGRRTADCRARLTGGGRGISIRMVAPLVTHGRRARLKHFV